MSYHQFCTVKIHEDSKPKIFKLQKRNLKKNYRREKKCIL